MLFTVLCIILLFALAGSEQTQTVNIVNFSSKKILEGGKVRSFGSKAAIEVASSSSQQDSEHNYREMTYYIIGGLCFVVLLCVSVAVIANKQQAEKVRVAPESTAESIDLETNQNPNIDSQARESQEMVVIDEQSADRESVEPPFTVQNLRTNGGRLDSVPQLNSDRDFNDLDPLNDQVRARSSVGDDN